MTGGRQDPAALAQTLAETVAGLQQYIEARAREIAAPRIAEAQEEARAIVAAVWHVAAFDARRSRDLMTELRRCLKAAQRQADEIAALGVALLEGAHARSADVEARLRRQVEAARRRGGQ